MVSGSARSLAVYVTVANARAAIEFYRAAFGAEERFALVDPGDGRIGHAELTLAGATLMLSDEYPDFGALSPETFGGSPVKLQLYVDDADAVFRRALDLGAAELRPLKDQFFGDRSGTLIDPFGHTWTIAKRVTEVPPAEMQRLWNAAMEG